MSPNSRYVLALAYPKHMIKNYTPLKKQIDTVLHEKLGIKKACPIAN